MGFAALTMCESDLTISWKEEVEESVWYTEASKRCFPDALSLCSERSVLKRPVEERKSGTKT